MGKFIDITGQKFGRLTVISKAGSGQQGIFWLCSCECGNKKIIQSHNLRYNRIKSCGCLKTEMLIKKKTTHGYYVGRANPTYDSWRNMQSRCNNPKDKGYKNYGGRGVKICEQWNSFENFFADMGKQPKGLTIERIDNEKGYLPENCKWATITEQMRNTRRNHMIEYKGKIKCLTDWANDIGIQRATLACRLKTHPPGIAFNM